MKKIAALTVKIVLGLVLFILVLMLTVPVLFKGKIKTKVEAVINESVNAKVAFSDYSVGFFRNFPNLSFSLKEVSVVGKEKFEGDTLAGFRSFDLVFNLGSLFSKSGYEIKSIILDKAAINGIVLEDGSANWDITVPSDSTATAEPASVAAEDSEASSGSLKLLMRKFEIRNSAVTYSDAQMKVYAILDNINFMLSGDMTLSTTDLLMSLSVGSTSVEMEGIKYLKGARIDSKIGLKANLDSMKFEFGENYFGLNDLRLNFSGIVAMPGEDIYTDITFGTESTSFKTLLSMVPAVYMSGYEDLKATGDLSLTGEAKGTYSEADSTLPDVRLTLKVDNGLISYPALPEKISNIGIDVNIKADGGNLDNTTVAVDRFHFELAGNPFDFKCFVKTPISDPDFTASAKGRIDLQALTNAVPVDSIKLRGIVDMAIEMAGKMSMLEKEEYEKFTARGTLAVSNMGVEMVGYPGIEIKTVQLLFTPSFTQLQKAELIVENTSDFTLAGNLENYIPYLFSDGVIKGNLSMVSKNLDVSAMMNALSSDTTVVETEDTTALAVIAIPRNISFDFSASIDKLSYDNIKAENIRGHIIVNDGVLTFKDAGMNMLGGSVKMNAEYDTRDTLKPVLEAGFDMTKVNVSEAFNAFVTVQKFAPAAKGINGKVSARLDFSSLLGPDMMPVLQSIEGYGKLQSDELQLVESKTFDKIKDVLKLGEKYSNTFKNINVSFRISDGRVIVSPFDISMGNIKMNISGDQGLDQTLNYIVNTQIPRADLGSSVNSLIDNLSSQASALGFAFKPSEIIKVPVKVGGTFSDPKVAPYFGSGGDSGASGGLKEGLKETARETVSSTVEKGKEALKDEAAEMGDKLIREAEEQGQKLREEAARAAIRIKAEADSSAQKLIKAAEPKGAFAKIAATKSGDALKKEADKRGNQLVAEADNKAKKLVEEAKAKKEELINKK